MSVNRRTLLGALATGAFTGGWSSARAQTTSAFGLPMGWDGAQPGDGVVLRHAFDVENTSFAPGWWHTGENWYLDFDGNSAGAVVYAIADGTVVFAGSDYPGRVVIIEHDGGLYSMYGHLDYDLLTWEGEQVSKGQMIARVLNKTDGRSPSHLHFEIRSFVTQSFINGDDPWYGVNCGYQCPPGPGYWPMVDGRLPTEIGWLNPLHVIYGRAYDHAIPAGAEMIVTTSADWFPTRETPGGENTGHILIAPAGTRLPLLDIAIGDEATLETSATAYSVWCKVVRDMRGEAIWIPAVRATSEFVQSDGRPATIRIDLLPG